MAYAEELLGYLDKAWGEGQMFGSNWVVMVYGLKGGVYADEAERPGIWLSTLDEHGKISSSLSTRVEIQVKDSGRLIYTIRDGYKKRSAGSLNLHFSKDLETDAAAVMETFETLTELAAGEGEPVPAGGAEGEGGRAPEEPAAKTWQSASTEDEIIRLFPSRPKYDELLDLHAKAKSLRSNRLMNLVRSRSQYAESAKTVVKNLLQ